ncbi:MAG: hypothetical protein Q8L88_03905 [Bacteroidota bacterium]|nr:hypothetical protein [Bacteroidota bacterium]
MRLNKYFLLFIFVVPLAHSQHSQEGENKDLQHSVFGPPRPALWEFQLGRMNRGNEDITSFNFYRKDQRNKTLFFKMSDNDLNSRSEFRVKEVTAGAVLFPINDDDRYQLELGGTYDVIHDTTLGEKALYSRLTYRPIRGLWFRFGSEYFDGYTAGHPSPYKNTTLNSNYVVGKVTVEMFSLVGLVGRGKINDVLNTRYGAAAIAEGPFNLFVLGGYIRSDEPKENVRTLAVGRGAPYRPDGLPSGMFIWKHRENYDFQIGGIFFGNTNLFVQPAAIGMSQGMFISSVALRENSKLRQGQLMSITDDYRNSDITMFYVYLNQGITMMPGKVNHVGFRVIQLYKIFDELNIGFISKPVAGLFYNEETAPNHLLVDITSKFFSYQLGITVNEKFILNMIYAPKKEEWTTALSFVY